MEYHNGLVKDYSVIYI